MDDLDLAVRNATYLLFVRLGRAPRAEEVAPHLDRSISEVQHSWRRLHQQHALVLHGGTGELRMANPFSAVATAHRVHAAGRWWYANCAWDALGVCAALGSGGRVETSCADCGDPINLDVEDGRPSDDTLVFHCLVPASRWWDDIVFT